MAAAGPVSCVTVQGVITSTLQWAVGDKLAWLYERFGCDVLMCMQASEPSCTRAPHADGWGRVGLHAGWEHDGA